MTTSCETLALSAALPAGAVSKRAHLRIALLGAAILAACLSLSPRPAAAQGFESDFFSNTMKMLGLADEEKPEIEYRERAPLVVPPSADQLPPPKPGAASKMANWPKDPDVQRRKREKEASNAPIIRDDGGKPLLPSELNKGWKKRNAASSNAVTEPNTNGPDGPRATLMPNQLGFMGWNNPKDMDKLTFTGEPERESLVEPPPGYQTPAPNAPYGVVEKKAEPFKLPTLFDRQ